MTSTMSLVATLPGLVDSLDAATSALPKTESILPANDGITLLDAKNEIFLAYLQTLALRNLDVIRSVRRYVPNEEDVSEEEEGTSLQDKMVKDLVKHRVYLEKGIRPLEERLKYQIDKVIRAADDEERQKASKAQSAAKVSGHAERNAAGNDSDEDSEGEDSDAESGADEEINELAHRPNLATFSRPKSMADNERLVRESNDGFYKPPRISATMMPTTERREKRDGKPNKSATIDEYVSTELSAAPTAEPSIGSTIVDRGRRDKSVRERAVEAERRDYEETHLMRLPKEAKKGGKQGGRGGAGYGGEEWRGIGEGVDRIDRLTKKKSGSGGALEKSRKRRLTEDGPRGDGGDPGAAFEMRKKRVMRRAK